MYLGTTNEHHLSSPGSQIINQMQSPHAMGSQPGDCRWPLSPQGYKSLIRRRAHMQWAVSLVIADGHFNFPIKATVGGYHGLTFTHHHTTRVSKQGE